MELWDDSRLIGDQDLCEPLITSESITAHRSDIVPAHIAAITRVRLGSRGVARHTRISFPERIAVFSPLHRVHSGHEDQSRLVEALIPKHDCRKAGHLTDA